MIEKLHIENFRIYESFTLKLNGDLNIIVGDNEAGIEVEATLVAPSVSVIAVLASGSQSVTKACRHALRCDANVKWNAAT